MYHELDRTHSKLCLIYKLYFQTEVFLKVKQILKNIEKVAAVRRAINKLNTMIVDKIKLLILGIHKARLPSETSMRNGVHAHRFQEALQEASEEQIQDIFSDLLLAIRGHIKILKLLQICDELDND